MTKRLLIYIVIIAVLLLALVTAIIVIILSVAKGFSAEPLPYFPTHADQTVLAEDVSDSTAIFTHLPSETETPFITPELISTPIPEILNTPTTEPDPTTETAQETSIPDEGLCQIPDRQTFLLIGEDSARGDPPFGSEWIRLIQIDLSKQSMTVFSFPRYLDLPTPDLYSTYGIPQYILGTIYHAVYQRVANQPDASVVASNAIGQAIFDNFGIVSSHFLTINQDSLQAVLEFLGPLAVENPAPFSSTEFEFPQGSVQIDKNNGWEFIFSNSPVQLEYTRLERQDQVFIAAYRKLHDEKTHTEFSNWLSQNDPLMVSDLSSDQLSAFACVIQAIPPENIVFIHFPETWVTLGDQKITITNQVEVKNFINQVFSQE